MFVNKEVQICDMPDSEETFYCEYQVSVPNTNMNLCDLVVGTSACIFKCRGKLIALESIQIRRDKHIDTDGNNLTKFDNSIFNGMGK